MSHSTTNVLNPPEVTAIVLVGPPASGKSTLRALFSDYDVFGCDLETYHKSGSIDGSKWEYLIDQTISAASEEHPKLVCIEGAISEEEVDYIRDNTDEVLVIKVDVPDDDNRINRYVQRELTELEDDVVNEERVSQIEIDAFGRHHHEMPYPDHDVSIINKTSTSTTELSMRCQKIVSLLS